MMTDLFSLAGRKALVTGANTGIGQAIAISLAGQGAHVICAGRRACDETVSSIEAEGGSAQSLLLDFADPMAARDVFVDTGVSILVNNAGIIRRDDSVDYGRVAQMNCHSERALPETEFRRCVRNLGGQVRSFG